MGSDWGPLVLADDLAHRPVLTVTPEDNLHTALRRMTELNIDELPVVDPKDPTRLIGLLSRRQLTLAYTSLIDSLRPPPRSHPSRARPGRPWCGRDDPDEGPSDSDTDGTDQPGLPVASGHETTPSWYDEPDTRIPVEARPLREQAMYPLVRRVLTVTRRRRILLTGVAVACLIGPMTIYMSSERVCYVRLVNNTATTLNDVVVTHATGHQAIAAVEPGKSSGCYVPHRSITWLKASWSERGRDREHQTGFSMGHGFYLSEVRFIINENNLGTDYDHAMTFELVKIKVQRFLESMKRSFGF